MWNMMTLSFLMCIFTATLIRVQVAADAAADCAACKYDSTSDVDCVNLKKYLKCLEDAAGTTDGCTLSTDDANKVKNAPNCSPPLVSPCTCQKDFWGSDLTGDKECTALKTYIGCLTTDATKFTCDAKTLASVLVTKPQGRSDSKCTADGPKTTAPGSTTPTPADKKDSGASPLRTYSTIASFLPFILAAFRL